MRKHPPHALAQLQMPRHVNPSVMATAVFVHRALWTGFLLAKPDAGLVGNHGTRQVVLLRACDQTLRGTRGPRVPATQCCAGQRAEALGQAKLLLPRQGVSRPSPPSAPAAKPVPAPRGDSRPQGHSRPGSSQDRGGQRSEVGGLPFGFHCVQGSSQQDPRCGAGTFCQHHIRPAQGPQRSRDNIFCPVTAALSWAGFGTGQRSLRGGGSRCQPRARGKPQERQASWGAGTS